MFRFAMIGSLCVLAARTISAPAEASRREIALPIPRPAPVTTATLFAKDSRFVSGCMPESLSSPSNPLAISIADAIEDRQTDGCICLCDLC